MRPLACAVAAVLAAPTVALSATEPAASSDSDALSTIVVVAQRRAENLQDVPITVVAVSADALDRAGINSVADLALISPSLTTSQEAQWSHPHLHGIGTTATGPGVENSVAMYVDGVYYASMVGGAANFNNIQAVEVLNGPQGTLFGRNASGGLIQIRTKDPSHEFSGSASLGFGNYSTADATLYLTGEISQSIAADIAVSASNQGQGFGRNRLSGREVEKTSNVFVRSKWLFTPSDDIKVTASADFGHVSFRPALQPAPGTQPIGGAPELAPHDLYGIYEPDGTINVGGLSVSADFNLHPLHLLSISAYRKTNSTTGEDSTLTGDPVLALGLSLTEPHEQFSQEFQLSSPSDGPFTWTAGAYFFHETSKYDPTHLYTVGLFDPVSDLYFYTTAKTDSFALYAQGTYALGPATNLTLGARYTQEKRKFNLDNQVVGVGGIDFGTVSTDGNRTFSAPSWRLSIDHKFTDSLMAYASYNRGFKSGGWNPAYLPALSYSPEKLNAFEVGVKSEALERRLQLNASVFYYKYKNVQVQGYNTGVLIISNGAEARLYGADLDFNARVTHDLTLHVGVGLLDSKFTSYPNADLTSPTPGGGTTYGTADASGHRLPLAAKTTGNISLDYIVPLSSGDLHFTAVDSYNGGWNAEPDGRLKQGSYNTINAEVGWTSSSKKWELSLWGKNLGDKAYATSLYSQFQGDVIQYAAPRTYGVSIKSSF